MIVQESENSFNEANVTTEQKQQDTLADISEKIGTDFTYKHKINWINLIGYIVYHILGIIGGILFIMLLVHPITIIYSMVLFSLGGIGITVGAHRYFTHRAYKVTTTLRRLLIILFILNGQNSLWAWVRNHRQHHKYSDTDADPHNSRRGLYFSHIGWFLTYKSPTLKYYGKLIDMSDLNADPWIMFQRKYFIFVYFFVTFFIPSIIPVLMWNEDLVKSFLVCFFARTCFTLNIACTVNSFAHAYGNKPYDKSIVAVENKYISVLSFGEGWHNYHHVFPWDYRASEFKMPLNYTTALIEWGAKKGWIYDLKVASAETIKKRIERTGENVY